MKELTISKSAFREIKAALEAQGLDRLVSGPRITMNDIELREGEELYPVPSTDNGLLVEDVNFIRG